MSIQNRPLPGGRYRITRAENAALCEAVGVAPRPDDRAHPIFFYIATQLGMGVSVAELCALCDFDVADGPMITNSDVAFDGDLEVEHDYIIAGEILSLVRKPSRTFGAVDLLTYRLTMSDEAGQVAATCTNSWVLPRRGEAAQ